MKPLKDIIAESSEPGYVALDALQQAGYVIVDAAIDNGKNFYLKELLKAGAVDDTRMKFSSYKSLAECLKLWGLA